MLSNCAQCQFFDHKPNHHGDIRCGIAPAYAAMWLKLKSLDESTLNAVPVDNCRDFELDSRLEKKEISLSLTYRQWQRLIKDYDCPETILNALDNKRFEHSLSLTLSDWQAIANSSDNYSVLNALEQQGVKREEPEWIDVSSSCIQAVRFDRSQSCLYIRFTSHSVYQYEGFNSELFQDFLNANSKGQFFNRYIKEEFPYSLCF